MQRTIQTLCALCAIAALCEQTTADSPFAAPVRMLAGLEIALTAMEILRGVRAFLLRAA